MRIVNLEQRSPEWLEWRNVGLGSSDAGVILGVTPKAWKTADKLLLEKREAFHGGPKGTGGRRDNSAMARGRRLEPLIVGMYEDLMGVRLRSVCAVHEEYSFLKASYDGWCEEQSLAVEVKAPNRDDHRCALDGNVPPKYVPQCLHLMLVAGIRFMHYVSYNDYFDTGERFIAVPVTASEGQLRDLLAAEVEFWNKVTLPNPESQSRDTKTKKGNRLLRNIPKK